MAAVQVIVPKAAVPVKGVVKAEVKAEGSGVVEQGAGELQQGTAPKAVDAVAAAQELKKAIKEPVLPAADRPVEKNRPQVKAENAKPEAASVKPEAAAAPTLAKEVPGVLSGSDATAPVASNASAPVAQHAKPNVRPAGGTGTAAAGDNSTAVESAARAGQCACAG